MCRLRIAIEILQSFLFCQKEVIKVSDENRYMAYSKAIRKKSKIHKQPKAGNSVLEKIRILKEKK